MSDFPLTFPVKILLLGAGELGKELTISLQRLGCQVMESVHSSRFGLGTIHERNQVFSSRFVESTLLDFQRLQTSH